MDRPASQECCEPLTPLGAGFVCGAAVPGGVGAALASFVACLENRAPVGVTYRDSVALDGTGGHDRRGDDLEGGRRERARARVGAWMPSRAVHSQSPPRCQTLGLPAL